MEIFSSNDFHILCRTCLSKNEELIPLQNSGYEEIVSLVSKIQPVREQKLPSGVCHLCFRVLKTMKAFIDKCRDSDDILQLVLGRQEITGSIETIIINSSSNEIEEVYLCDHSYSKTNSEKPIEGRDTFREIENQLDVNVMDENSCRSEYSCEIFDSAKNQHYIQSAISEEERFKCKVCSKLFNRRYKLKAHMRCHTKENPFICTICSKTFRYRANLRRHQRVHDGIKPYVCEICGKRFSRSALKVEHLRVHTGETPYICQYCGKGFKSARPQKIHELKHQLDNGELLEKIYKEKCSKCDKRFNSKYALRLHELMHTGEKQFSCDECDKRFFTKVGLQTHLKMHTGEKPYECSHCGKSFSQRLSWRDHVHIHLGVKPYKCDVCNRSFVQRPHLTSHMRTHSGEKPYVCPHCSRAFATSGNLKVHIRTHTGETPYCCSVCNVGFYDSSSLKRHKKRHETFLDSNE